MYTQMRICIYVMLTDRSIWLTHAQSGYLSSMMIGSDQAGGQTVPNLEVLIVLFFCCCACFLTFRGWCKSRGILKNRALYLGSPRCKWPYLPRVCKCHCMMYNFWVHSIQFVLIQIRADDNIGVFVRMRQLADVRLYVHGVAGKVTEKQMLRLALGKSSAALDSNYKCLEPTSPLMKDQVCLLVYVCVQFDMCDTYAHVYSNVRAYKFFEHIELPAKLLVYFVRSNKSNMTQCILMRVEHACGDMHIHTKWWEVTNQSLCKPSHPPKQCAHLISLTRFYFFTRNSLQALLEIRFTWYTHRYGKMRMGMTASGTRSPGNLSFCAKISNRVWVSVMLILHCICYVYCQIQPMTNVNWNPGHWLYSMWVQYTNTSHDDVLPVCYQWFVAGTENLQVAYAT